MVLSQISEEITIFFSLAPQDRALFEKLRNHLSALKRLGLIDKWYDSLITVGSNTGNIIDYMKRAHIIVLLMSANFLASDQCAEVEMPLALERGDMQAAYVIPVLLRPTDWGGFPPGCYSLLPANGEAVSVWENLDSALTEMAKGIHRTVDELVSQATTGTQSSNTPVFPSSHPDLVGVSPSVQE